MKPTTITLEAIYNLYRQGHRVWSKPNSWYLSPLKAPLPSKFMEQIPIEQRQPYIGDLNPKTVDRFQRIWETPHLRHETRLALFDALWARINNRKPDLTLIPTAAIRLTNITRDEQNGSS